MLGGELEVRRLGFGAMRIVDDREEGVRVLRRAVELGVNFIDTANIYVAGRSEEILGEGLTRGSAYEITWLLDRSPVMLVIPGTSSVAHLEENMRAVV